MLIVYRIFWIVGLIALIAELVILANPRQSTPQKASDWEIVQRGRFQLRAPKQFQIEREPRLLWELGALGNEVRILDSLTLERGKRTGLKITIAAPGNAPTTPPFGQQSLQPAFDMSRFLRRAHDLHLAAMREDLGFVGFVEKRRSPVRIRGVQGIRSDYEYTIPHPVPFLSMPVRGYLITLPLSQTEVVHFNAYCPPNSFGDYQKIYDQIIATAQVQSGDNPMSGGWLR
ncbi:MAG: hypothetical protein CFK49_07570 [Armatimonadetes bacterium JP3_11]|jgi:hypothetical protein|nr:MAG: hypothetical protein CFK48_06485 [Armatimonadetes bacterium CP1_7O]OYT74589.1 MAG: hypothetical protein CFK49_07570 [Armatimonadetes bacterium JP3_11]RMH10108.1 MAG: hypothetical protein D6697_01955 [Armatimonadota bacterium]